MKPAPPLLQKLMTDLVTSADPVAEVLHRRIDYTPDHLIKVGWVTTPIPPYATGAALARLRNGHLFCLRYESEQDDFGDDIPEGSDG